MAKQGLPGKQANSRESFKASPQYAKKFVKKTENAPVGATPLTGNVKFVGIKNITS